MNGVVFDPYFVWPVIGAVAAFAAVVVGVAMWRGLPGWWLRALSAIVLIAALANPSVQNEERAALSDIVVLVVDESASQALSDRPDQIAQSIARIETEIAQLPNTELATVTLGDGEDNAGSLVMGALAQAMAEQPRARLAGAILLTDGQVHDIKAAPDLPAPLHVLLTGRQGDWDRRLIVKNAPAYAILDEEVTLVLRLEDQGDVPASQTGTAQLSIAIDGGAPGTYTVPVGRAVEVPITVPHGGMNVLQFSTPMIEGELTDRNNSAVVQINGVRDRLRVLLVSGEPHPGERTWRNLLKSDSSVDLVHFTILRPPDKQDGVPVSELSLIAFPTRELFMDKIDEFDLIIFDRYKRRGILPSLYLDNVRQYVEAGGAVLVAAGPDFATADSLYRSPLGPILPGAPTSRVLESGFRPQITDLGARHPVTAGLDSFAAQATPDAEGPAWGRWFRLIGVTETAGQTVMSGDDRPLLLLDRVGQGRIALLASDHAWLWSRGFEGGGPQLELLRRLAHWMMKEPELEEEALVATATGQSMTITRRSLSAAVGDVQITGPDGTETTLSMQQVAPGRFETTFEAPEIGLYRLSNGDKDAVIALGPSAPKEFDQTVASSAVLEPLVDLTNGGIRAVEDGVPDVRTVRAGRPAAGRGWIGITPRDAYTIEEIRIFPLLPAWLWVSVAALLAVGAWLREGRN
ncbi:hypothetical protein ACP2AV_03380 [Aliiroseovarius sp. PTFE2010]|uniref:hypothetical protein n=1 Tax=Aliiroseovarius sp. PTFE2010 TaxID=3417190 RepID=UPI003CEB7710